MLLTNLPYKYSKYVTPNFRIKHPFTKKVRKIVKDFLNKRVTMDNSVKIDPLIYSQFLGTSTPYTSSYFITSVPATGQYTSDVKKYIHKL